MKKLFYTTFLLGSIAAANAQPVLQQANLPAFGTTAPLSVYPGAVNPGSGGANQTWDFSALTMIPAGNASIVDPTTTPNTATYPNATMAYKIDFTVPTPHTEYNYYLESSGKWELLASEIGGTDPDDYTPNYRTELEFPLNYNDVISDMFQTTDMGSPGPLTRTYDGYGTLITPFGTYTNAVRIAYSFDGGTTTNYQWIIPNPVIMVFSYSTEENMAIAIGASAITGVNEMVANNITLFPTLVTNGFTVLSNTQNVARVNLIDATGRVIRQFENPVNGILDLSNITPGMYFARVESNDGAANAVKISVQ